MEYIEEIWEDIKNYKGCYQISNFGRIKSCKRTVMKNNGVMRTYKSKHRKTTINRDGYPRIKLSKHGKIKTCTVHRLVAENFIKNIENKKCVNHIDGNKTNNRVDNLEWCTHEENMKHAYKSKLINNYGEGNGKSKLKLNDVVTIINLYKKGNATHKELASKFRVSETTICNIVNGKRWGRVMEEIV